MGKPCMALSVGADSFVDSTDLVIHYSLTWHTNPQKEVKSLTIGKPVWITADFRSPRVTTDKDSGPNRDVHGI